MGLDGPGRRKSVRGLLTVAEVHPGGQGQECQATKAVGDVGRRHGPDQLEICGNSSEGM